MNGLTFHRAATVNDGPPVRADVACFVGLITPRAGKTATAEIANWLVAHSWALKATAEGPLTGLTGLPLPIENWAVFDGLYRWESRSSTAGEGPTYLGMAVRSFFAQGGRKCYVVSMGNSDSRQATLAAAQAWLSTYLPETFSDSDRSSWLNAGTVLPLEDVSYILLPDLPELVGSKDVPPATEPPPLPKIKEEFVVCSIGENAPALPDVALGSARAPRCDVDGYKAWSDVLNKLSEQFARTRVGREAQILAALPMPLEAGSLASGNSLIDDLPIEAAVWSFSSGFVQVCYPWLITDESASLPEGVIPPDGAFAGLLARHALSLGAYKDASLTLPNQVYDVFPHLSADTYVIPETQGPAEKILVQRVSLFGPTPAGYRLLSDMTVSKNGEYRRGAVRRLICMLHRAARDTGQTMLFMASGPRLWERVQNSLTALLTRFWQAGALDGDSAAQAFSVRCDRSTMTQADIDAGRLIAEISLTPAWSIETIRVTLAVSGGEVTAAAPELDEVA